MRKVYLILFIAMLACVGCEWRLRPHDDKMEAEGLVIHRYDRIESLYLTTGDYSALQQLNTTYPMQTRTLIEDVLHIGRVNEPDINAKFFHFFSDSTLQVLIDDVQRQYADMEDISKDLSRAFGRLKDRLPSLEIPQIYTQIGSFDQSIIVGNATLGISLDKYLGENYPFYVQHYSTEQRRMMTRSMIVPDCLGFYILSLFPMPIDKKLTKTERDIHMSRIQWVVNKVMGKSIFRHQQVEQVDHYMKKHKHLTVEQLLRNTDYSEMTR